MSTGGRPRVALFDFAGCEGCQLTVIDSLQDHPELLAAVEIVQFREAMTAAQPAEDYLVAFVEGACTRPSDDARLKAIRERAGVVVALGACAHLGGVNALRYWRPLDEARRYVYGERAEWYEAGEVRPIEAIIPVDHVLPGCPIDRHEFVACVKALLLGVRPPVPDYPVCVECRSRENVCLFARSRVCLGPVTRAGCGAICPTYGQSCEGCRGLVPNPNEASMGELLAAHGASEAEVASMVSMFNAYRFFGPAQETDGERRRLPRQLAE